MRMVEKLNLEFKHIELALFYTDLDLIFLYLPCQINLANRAQCLVTN